MKQVTGSPGNKVAMLLLITVVVAFFHYVIPTDRHFYHMLHIGLRKLYFLPIVIAAAWFGLRGSVYAALSASILFSLHAFLDWPGNYMEQANQVGELGSFWVVGLVSGFLFDRERSLLKKVAQANEETIFSLVSALDLREKNTRFHSQRVRDYTLIIAKQLGAHENIERTIGLGALLHDIGKIAVPDHILLKPGKLTSEEWEIMRTHAAAGYNLIKEISFLKDVAEIVYSHHEHFDGSGYPRGLKGDEIHMGARLFAVIDVYDALTSERPYRSPMNHQEAISVIKEESGAHFDPTIVEVFLRMDNREFEMIKNRFRDNDVSSNISL